MWVFVEDEWHQAQGQPVVITGGSGYETTTTCGITAAWNGTILDVAPAEGAHEGCPAPKSDEEVAVEEEKSAARAERAAAKNK